MTDELADQVMQARSLVALRVMAMLDDNDEAAVRVSFDLERLPMNVRDIAWARLVQLVAEGDGLNELLLRDVRDAGLHAAVSRAQADVVAGAEALLDAEPDAGA